MKNLIYFLIAVLLIGVIFGFTLSDEKNTSNNTENTSLTITEPGNYDVSKYDEIIVDIDTSTEINLQDKTVTPGETSQTIIPDLNYNGLGTVTVNPIPDDYINPDGSIDIIENGTYDVTNFESVNVNIPTTSYTEWNGTVDTEYRLLTADDVGKVFGVDLELEVFIDTSYELASNSDIFQIDKTINLTNFLISSDLYSEGYGFNMSRLDLYYFTTGGDYVHVSPLWEGSIDWCVLCQR